jgi:amino acid permease
VGAGMLTLSSALDKFGLINGIIMMGLSTFSLYMGLYCFRSLLLSYKDANIYSKLVEFIIGRVSHLDYHDY